MLSHNGITPQAVQMTAHSSKVSLMEGKRSSNTQVQAKRRLRVQRKTALTEPEKLYDNNENSDRLQIWQYYQAWL